MSFLKWIKGGKPSAVAGYGTREETIEFIRSFYLESTPIRDTVLISAILDEDTELEAYMIDGVVVWSETPFEEDLENLYEQLSDDDTGFLQDHLRVYFEALVGLPRRTDRTSPDYDVVERRNEAIIQGLIERGYY